ncbi:MAG: hypothetical protein JSR73_07630 [Proteobacteria bacterium]|nr:hypothetical protein [Pseudomonadota bacterium]
MPPYRAALAALLLIAATPSLAAAPVDRLLLRVETGATGLPAGARVELRIREAGRAERRLALPSGTAWPAGSTRTVPLTLAEPLDPDGVSRVGLFVTAPPSGSPLAWDVAGAEVFAVLGDGRNRPLGDVIRGHLAGPGELAAAERTASAMLCVSDADCDDGRSCNGRERCDPRDTRANARGCVAGTPVSCPTNQVCMERLGCRGMEGAPNAPPPAAITTAGAAHATAEHAPVAPGVPAAQSCSGRDVLLTDVNGATRLASCPAGTACVPQPNGTGICAPAR